MVGPDHSLLYIYQSISYPPVTKQPLPTHPFTYPPTHPPARVSIQPPFRQSPIYFSFCHLRLFCHSHLLITSLILLLATFPAAASTRSSPSASSSGSRALALLKSTARSCSNAFAESSRVPALAFRKWNADSMSLRPSFYVPSSRLCARMRR